MSSRRSRVPRVLLQLRSVVRLWIAVGGLGLLVGLLGTAGAQDGRDRIRLNQVGFPPDAPKHAVVVGAPDTSFSVVNAAGDTTRRGRLGPAQDWDLSGETVRRASFSDVSAPGTYRLVVPGTGQSHPFSVSDRVLGAVARAGLKAYYFQRASTALPERYAGRWARPAGHPDEQVRVHPSAASEARPEGSRIAAPKGWYDAGDYNKYVVNSGISTYTLLALAEHAPEAAAALSVHIPEGDDDVPDVVDEALWNLHWLRSMQAPDGGVYHKLTHAGFSGMVMPHDASSPRYVTQKSTAATLNAAAVMAQASRVLDGFAQHRRLADALQTAALDAWQWARAHPARSYDQSVLNAEHDPDVTTGAYGDDAFGDEFAWAAAELSVTTGADSFLVAASPLQFDPTVPSWPTVHPLGWYTLLEHRERIASAVDTSALKRRFLRGADELVDARGDVPYGTVMGHEAEDFAWGSSGVAGNQAMALLQAYRLTGDPTYRDAALSNLDYLLGRNATGYSFLTGMGDRSPMHIHHRPSQADTVEAPVPGLLAGGPNPGQQDRENCADAGATYSSDLPARSYLDHLCSYASNEVTINWNAPLVYTAALLDVAYAN